MIGEVSALYHAYYGKHTSRSCHTHNTAEDAGERLHREVRERERGGAHVREEVELRVDAHEAVGHRELQQQPQLRMCISPDGRPIAPCECDSTGCRVDETGYFVILSCLFYPKGGPQLSRPSIKPNHFPW